MLMPEDRLPAPATGLARWEQRYQGDAYLFGTQASAFLVSHAPYLPARGRVLAVADGEGRNGVWLAQRGYDVHAVDGSACALAKAGALARSRGVALELEQADLTAWNWPEARYDAVVAIFIQFALPDERRRLFAGMRQALRPGGILMLHGYTPRQIAFGTGGPANAEQLYTGELLRQEFAGMELLRLQAYEAELSEGTAHVGRSALVDLVARQLAP